MKKRDVRIEGDVAYVPLTQGYEAVVDASDVPLVLGKNWFAQVARRRDGSIRSVYALTQLRREDGKQRPERMHRVILGLENDTEGDHADGDGLNNRRDNLRPATHTENGFNGRRRRDNTSGFRGVSRDDRKGLWRARIRVARKLIHLGWFSDPLEAAAAYADASVKYHGAFANVGT